MRRMTLRLPSPPRQFPFISPLRRGHDYTGKRARGEVDRLLRKRRKRKLGRARNVDVCNNVDLAQPDVYSFCSRDAPKKNRESSARSLVSNEGPFRRVVARFFQHLSSRFLVLRDVSSSVFILPDCTVYHSLLHTISISRNPQPTPVYAGRFGRRTNQASYVRTLKMEESFSRMVYNAVLQQRLESSKFHHSPRLHSRIFRRHSRLLRNGQHLVFKERTRCKRTKQGVMAL